MMITLASIHEVKRNNKIWEAPTGYRCDNPEPTEWTVVSTPGLVNGKMTLTVMDGDFATTFGARHINSGNLFTTKEEAKNANE